MEINENVMTQVILMNVAAIVNESTKHASENVKQVGNSFADRITQLMAIPDADITDDQKSEMVYLDHMLGHMSEILDKLTLVREINDVGYKRVLINDKELTEADLAEVKAAMEATPEYKKMTDTIERHKRENAAMNSDDAIEMIKLLMGGNPWEAPANGN